jgi:hypothetical protein
MCVKFLNKRWKITKREIIAYKIFKLKGTELFSWREPWHRNPQLKHKVWSLTQHDFALQLYNAPCNKKLFYRDKFGKSLRYSLNTEIHATYPGLYMYTTQESTELVIKKHRALVSERSKKTKIVSCLVVIPIGAKYRMGQGDCINATSIIPLRILESS